MAYITKKIGDRYNQPTYYFECDDIADMADIPLLMVPMGSRCFVINEGAQYALNSNHEWKLVEDDDDDNNTEEESVKDAVQYIPQELTEAQQTQVKKNLDLYREGYKTIFQNKVLEFDGYGPDFESDFEVGDRIYLVVNDNWINGIISLEPGGSAAPDLVRAIFSFNGGADIIHITRQEDNTLTSIYWETIDAEGHSTPHIGTADVTLEYSYIRTVPDRFIPSTCARLHNLPKKLPYVADVTAETVSVETFNSLLQALRNYGYMEQEAN